MKKFKKLKFVNQNVALQSSTPKRFAAVDGKLKGIYQITSNSRVQGSPIDRYLERLEPISTTKKTFSIEEAEKMFPEYFLN
jgi:hypothetical protein